MSRQYRRIYASFWVGSTGRTLREAGRDVQVLALYLVTSPHGNMIGLYHLPLAYVCHDAGFKDAEARTAFDELQRIGFAQYDPASEHVWVVEMARFQILGDAAALKSDDNVVKNILELYDRLPDNPYLRPFFDRYHDRLHLVQARGDDPTPGTQTSPLEGPSEGLVGGSSSPKKPLRSQEQGQGAATGTLLSPDGDELAPRRQVGNLVELYNATVTYLPKVQKLTDKRRRKAESRLREQPDLEWWRTVIRRADATPFCRGEGKNHWRASFDFLVENDTNAVKVLEGKYDDPDRTRTTATPRGRTIEEVRRDQVARREAAAREGTP